MTHTREGLLAMCDEVLKMFPDNSGHHFPATARALKSLILAQPTRDQLERCIDENTDHVMWDERTLADAIIKLYTPEDAT